MLVSGLPLDLVRNALELPFAFAAGTTGYEGFALAKEESGPLVPQADHLIAQYMPGLGPNGVAIMFSLSMASLAAVKYMGYQAHKKEQAKKPKGAA